MAELGREGVRAIVDAQGRIFDLHQVLGQMLPYLHAREPARIGRRLDEELTLRQMNILTPPGW